MKQFLKDYGILILAIWGIAQYWIAVAWFKWIRKGKVEIYKTGTVEIGYSYPYGTTIGLNGTLRTFNKNICYYSAIKCNHQYSKFQQK